MVLTREKDNVFHDELSEDYIPVYFHQFVDHAGRNDLQYLGESDYFEMNEALCPPAGMEVLMKFGPDQLVQKEQYMDFLKCRTFRQTLLCRRDAAPRREGGLDVIDRFRIETRAHPVPKPGGPDLSGTMEYKTARGATMTTVDPFVQRMMARLETASPWALSYGELLPGGELGGGPADLPAADVLHGDPRAAALVADLREGAGGAARGEPPGAGAWNVPRRSRAWPMST